MNAYETSAMVEDDGRKLSGRRMNVLIDTNILLSAALSDRLPESVVL